MKTSLKAKDFCWFWGAAAVLILALAAWLIYRFVQVAGLPEMRRAIWMRCFIC